MITAEETDGQFLQRLGMDGMLWSQEMHKRFPQVPQDDLLGWCCNMIMAGYDEAVRRQTELIASQAEELKLLKDLLTEIQALKEVK